MARTATSSFVIKGFHEAKGKIFTSFRKASNFIMTRLSAKDSFILDEVSGEFEITRNGETVKGKIVIEE